MQDMNKVLDEVHESLKALGKEYPEQMHAFSSFMKSTEKDGALDHKTKELISLALSIATHCKWCIAIHTKNALEAGASKDEIMESCFVAALMGGGPSLMYTQLAVKAMEDYEK